ncbi:TIR domain-containing protein [Mesorhizobium sp. M0830]|uniref:nSTAND1 domain-containing NTPase n=1 Tax=Mesorhizobium sp. M0830 TaxID=2957008 RepID=UPI003339E62F
MARIFLSHSSIDCAKAIALGRWLEQEGWNDYFLDLHPERGIVAGERWEQALSEAAHRCQAVLFLVSPAWLGSRWCHEELQLAHRLNKHIFGVLIEEVELQEVPPKLKDHWQLVDLARGRDHTPPSAVELPDGSERHVTFSRSGLGRLKAGLLKAEIDARFFAWPPAGDPDRPPYRGMRPLEAEDAGIFFGRDAPIIEVLDHLRELREAAPPRFLAILGASGAGKSSFLRAGLLPRLLRDDRIFLPLPIVRPERAVLHGESGLVASIGAALKRSGLKRTRAQVEEAIAGGAVDVLALLSGLAEQARAQKLHQEDEQPPSPVLVLPIDQGEELFQAEGREEAQVFLSLLGELLAAGDPKLILLITIRSDSYELLQSATELEGIRQTTFSLPPLPRGSYQTVIEGPATRLKDSERALKIEPALTAQLLRDVEEGSSRDALPLLAFTLERLYDKHGGDGDLTLAEYRKMGGIAGSIEAAMERILQRADADPAVPRDPEARLALLRRAMIPWLAGIDPETGSPRRQVARMSEIPAEARPLVRHLIAERLLSSEQMFVSRDPVQDGPNDAGTQGRGDSQSRSTMNDPIPTSASTAPHAPLVKVGEVTVEPAHEALLRQWGLLRGWLEQDFAALMTLEGVRRAARDWEANARDAAWLSHQAGRLEDAERLKDRSDLAARLDATDRDYLQAARAAENTRRDRELEEARKLVAAAEAARANETVSLAALSRVALSEGQPVHAIKLALAAWPRIGDERRPALQRTVDSLVEAFPNLLGGLTVSGHTQGMRSAAFSPDGTRIVTASGDTTARIWDTAIGTQLLALEGHTDRVTSAAFSPDSRHIVTASVDKTARVWDAASGAHVLTLDHQHYVRSSAFSPDGRRIVTLSGGTVQVWDTATGAEVLELYDRHLYFTSAALSPDGRHIITVSSTLDALRTTSGIWDVASGAQVLALNGHEGTVNSAAYSPDGASVITASDDSTARVWDAATGAQVLVLNGHEGGVTSATFLPDGKRIVTASNDRTARVWDAATGEQVLALSSHEYHINSAVFSPDGTRIVTSSSDNVARIRDVSMGAQVLELGDLKGVVTSATFSPDGTSFLTVSSNTVCVWNAVTGVHVLQLLCREYRVHSANFSPDGTRIVTASFDGTARVCDSESGVQLLDLKGHKGGVRSAAFSPDGTRIVTASMDGTARVWHGGTGEQVLELKGPQDDFYSYSPDIYSAAFSPDGTRIITASSEKTIRIWDALTGAQVLVLKGHETRVNSAAFSPDSTRIVTTSYDETACVWDALTGAQVLVLRGHENSIASVAFSPDGMRIATASFDETARVWDALTGAQMLVLKGHEQAVLSASFSPDSRRIVTESRETAFVWDASSGAELQALKAFHSASFSPDGTRIVAVTGDGIFGGILSVRDAATGAEVLAVQKCGHEGEVTSAAFSPDGTRVVTGSEDTTARVWHAATGAQLLVLSGHEHFVTSVAFSTDGARLVTTSFATSRVWDAATATLLLTMEGHEDTVTSAAFSPDCTRVVTTSSDRSARVWDAKGGEQLLVLNGHEDRVNSAAFSPSGACIVSASRDKSSRVWDVATGAQLLSLKGHGDGVNSAAFSPDGTRIVTASEDRTARVWDAATGAQLLSLGVHKEGVNSAAFSRDGMRIITASGNFARIWDITALEKGDAFQIACQRLGKNTDLSDIEARYGLSKLTPICGDNAPLPFDPATVR